jgi:predicted small secreted protein
MKARTALLVTALTLAASGAGAGVAAGPAAAAVPERFQFDFDFADTIDCSEFNPAWTFNDDFHDFFHVRGQVWLDSNGDPLRAIEHVHHVSNDVNSVTGLTLHEHNHYTVVTDFVAGTRTLNGAINIMERRGVGEVIQNSGHKVTDLATDEPLELHGPDMAEESDFCAAVAP